MTEMPDKGAKSRSDELGVSTGKDGVLDALDQLKDQIENAMPDAFCVVSPVPDRPDLGLIAHPDGVGNKAVVALMACYDKHPDGVRFLTTRAQDAVAMNDNDVGCMGYTGVRYLTNVVNRNPDILPDSLLPFIYNGYYQAAKLLREYGCHLIIAGGETADVGGPSRSFAMDASLNTLPVRLKDLINCDRMAPGDVIIGVSSSGQAAWETRPNSGIGSNGFTNLINDLLHHDYVERYPWSWNDRRDRELFFKGKLNLRDPLPTDPTQTVAEAMLSPTRLYGPFFKALFERLPTQYFHGIIHNTGGGLTKIKNFGRRGAATGNRYVLNDLFMEPPIFRAVREAGFTTAEQMPRTFNLGQLLFVVLLPQFASKVIQAAEHCGIEAKPVGYVEERREPGNEVVWEGNEGTFHYYQSAP